MFLAAWKTISFIFWLVAIILGICTVMLLCVAIPITLIWAIKYHFWLTTIFYVVGGIAIINFLQKWTKDVV